MGNVFARIGGLPAAVGAVAVVMVVVAAGFYLRSGNTSVEAPETVAAMVPPSQGDADSPRVAEPASNPEVQPAAQQDAAAPPITPDVPDDAMLPPAFDEVRREEDGLTLIAGRAVPGSEIKILQQGVEIARAVADGSGKFAAFATLPSDGQGHVLSLVQTMDGMDTGSEEDVILAPLAPPVVAAAPVDQPVPEQQDAADPVAEAQTDAAAPATLAEVTPDQPDAPVLTEQSDAEAPPAVTTAMSVAPAEIAAPSVVASPAPVAVLRSTAEGVELLNTPKPEAMTNVEIDTISYSALGEVELAGRAQADTSNVRVYLDNASVATLPVDAQGRWRGEVPNVDEGIYTLRIDEVASDGKVSSRVETPFKREAPEVLAAASAGQEGPLKAITVQKGATLWAIARDRYGKGELYVRVFEANANAIRDPDLIYPGQIFDLPD